MTERKRTSQWMNLLLVIVMPFGGFGCPAAAPVLIKLFIWVGRVLVTTAAGYTLEKALDAIFLPNQPKEEGAGEVVVDKTDPKKGIYKGTMKVRYENGTEVIVQDPPVVRNSESESFWTLDPKVKEEVRRKLQRQSIQR